MPAYLIADITVHDGDRFKDYVTAVPAYIEKHRGKYLVRGGKVEVKEGLWQPKRVVVIEFPTKENALAFLEDPGYQPVAAIRHEAAITNLVIVEGS